MLHRHLSRGLVAIRLYTNNSMWYNVVFEQNIEVVFYRSVLCEKDFTSQASYLQITV